MKNQILYTPIDYVGGDSRAIEFGGELSDRLVGAQAQIEIDKLPIKLSLRTAINSSAVSPEPREEFHRGLRKIADAGIDFWVDIYGSSPTRKMYGVLFDQGAIASGVSAIATSDLDQYPPDKNLDRIMLLHERTKKNEVVLGVGSRNVPVVLAANPENAHLRRIFEGIINLTIRADFLNRRNHKVHPPSLDEAPQDPAYNAHGDCVTGVYLFNPSPSISRNFADSLVKEAREHNFPGFEDEYLMTINALGFGNMVAEYFRSLPNPFSPCDPAIERERIIERQIKAPLRRLRKTDAYIPITITMDKAGDVLKPFYPPEQIEEVVGYMREALE